MSQPQKTVLLHTCFRPFAPFVLGAGQLARTCHERVNASCSCRMFISGRERDERMDRGELLFLVRQGDHGRRFPDYREVVSVFLEEYRSRPLLGPPRYTGIVRSSLERAYGIGGETGNADEANRVEAYGELGRAGGMMAWREDVLESVLAGA